MLISLKARFSKINTVTICSHKARFVVYVKDFFSFFFFSFIETQYKIRVPPSRLPASQSLAPNLLKVIYENFLIRLKVQNE